MQLQANDKILDLTRPQIMGILNITPDSFSDSGQFLSLDKALFQAEKMLNEGATIIDIGGESTRPGAKAVTVQQELDRVLPVLQALHERFDCWLSVDTSKAEVMQAAAQAGADLINDVRALQEPKALQVAAQSQLPVCLMHMQGQPRTMQQNPHYDNVYTDVLTFLQERTTACLQAGISREKILWDPGFGFGKTLAHNYALLKGLNRLCQQGFPVLVGMSRKSMIGNLLNRPVDERLVGSVTAALIATQKGAKILRVHDVAATKDALQVWEATL